MTKAWQLLGRPHFSVLEQAILMRSVKTYGDLQAYVYMPDLIEFLDISLCAWHNTVFKHY